MGRATDIYIILIIIQPYLSINIQTLPHHYGSLQTKFDLELFSHRAVDMSCAFRSYLKICGFKSDQIFTNAVSIGGNVWLKMTGVTYSRNF